MAICAEVEKRLLDGRGMLQRIRISRLSDVRDPEKYMEGLSRRLQLHAANARASGDKEKLAYLQKFEDKGYREKYTQLAVEERSVQRITQAEAKAAIERMRRLRERVASHRYLLMPTGCSVHAIVRTPQPAALQAEPLSPVSPNGKAVQMQDIKDQFWPPQTDIDIHMPSIPLSVDIVQARGIVQLIDFFKRWKIEDHRMMWYPPPHHTGYYAAFARWGYALRMVLHGVDERYPWRFPGVGGDAKAKQNEIRVC